MKTMAVADANEHFSAMLQAVALGEQILVMAGGKPVAKIIPVDAIARAREPARAVLLARLRGQTPTGQRH